MAAVVNLNRARKARARAEAKIQAAENRIRHGRTKAERALADMDRETAERRLDGHERDGAE